MAQTRIEAISTTKNNDEKYNINTLSNLIVSTFPIEYQAVRFQLFPFCNEQGYWRVIKNLNSIGLQETGNLKVALLFGESNFISMLPALVEITDLVLLADIEPNLHKHNAHLLKCLLASDTPQQFINLYHLNNPIEKEYSTNELAEQLIDKTACPVVSLRKHHFLNNQIIFNKCKEAAYKLPITQISMDVSKENESKILASILKENKACLSLCNFTNIHDYVSAEILKKSINALLKDNNCLIMHATGPKNNLRTTISLGCDKYFSHISQMPISLGEKHEHNNINPSLANSSLVFFSKYKQKSNSTVCYVAFKLSSPCQPGFIQDIFDAKSNINNFSTSLHAFDTAAEAEKFISELNPHNNDLENDYWIFSVRGNKEKVNTLLRFREYCDGKYQWRHYPSDYDGDSLEFISRIINATNNTKTVLIERQSEINDVPKLFNTSFNM